MADPRKVALDALIRIEEQDAYANLALGAILERSKLDSRDRGFVTELVYGVTRMRRALDFLVGRFALRPLDIPTRNLLRLGAYQLHYLRVPAHAAVSATVAIAPGKTRGLANAILRRVAEAPVHWPDDATRLSYPDWLVDRLVTDLGAEDALAALELMDQAPEVTERPDGYVQDLASQWVAAAVGAQPGERVADVCAAPGGKATALDGIVIASDLSPVRAGLVGDNAARLGRPVHVVAADARHPPYRPGSFDRVLVDAPCSGLGVLRRRPDARWRIDGAAIDRLAALQKEIVEAAIPLVRPGGTLVYSVCTLTDAETLGLDRWLEAEHPELVAPPLPEGPWRPHGRGALLLPQAAGTDGMALLRLVYSPVTTGSGEWQSPS
ncbi:MAG: rRNA cytosine-C5-methyltransferase [Actinomycetia bacterium]|nr:rRNA cytosine-C5-methyltransferase [Actinomycetes bacterium]